MQSNLFQGNLVRLSAYRPEDAADIARWSEDAEYARLMSDTIVQPRSAEEIAAKEHGDSRDRMWFRLRVLENDKHIGHVGFYGIQWNNAICSLGIGIGEREYRGKGYGADALRVALRYAFDELNMYRVGLAVIDYNAAAIRSYERAGFVREGLIRGAELRDGKRSDEILMGILLDEWARGLT